VRVRCRRKKFTFAISSPDEFLVCSAKVKVTHCRGGRDEPTITSSVVHKNTTSKQKSQSYILHNLNSSLSLLDQNRHIIISRLISTTISDHACMSVVNRKL